MHLVKIPSIYSPDLPSSLVIIYPTWQQRFHRNDKRIGINQITITIKSIILSTRRGSTWTTPTATTLALFRKIIGQIVAHDPSKPSGAKELLVTI